MMLHRWLQQEKGSCSWLGADAVALVWYNSCTAAGDYQHLSSN